MTDQKLAAIENIHSILELTLPVSCHLSGNCKLFDKFCCQTVSQVDNAIACTKLTTDHRSTVHRGQLHATTKTVVEHICVPLKTLNCWCSKSKNKNSKKWLSDKILFGFFSSSLFRVLEVNDRGKTARGILFKFSSFQRCNTIRECFKKKEMA